jgi:hypothetical protein
MDRVRLPLVLGRVLGHADRISQLTGSGAKQLGLVLQPHLARLRASGGLDLWRPAKGIADLPGLRKASCMPLLLIAGAVLLTVAIGVRLGERVMGGGAQRLGPSTAMDISRPRRMVGRALVAVGGLALPVLPLVWIAAANEPWHEFDNDREVLFAVAWSLTLVVLGLVVSRALLLGVVWHRRS